MTRKVFIVVCQLFFVCAALAADPPGAAELSDQLRTTLEEQFRANTGIGFASFDCDLPQDEMPGPELTCQAVDEDGDRFSYRIVADPEGGSPSVTTSQPVSQLLASGREKIERPCLAFLDAFERGAWSDAYQEFSTELKAGLSLADMETTLEPMREAFGDLRAVKAETYASPSPGLHQLEYSLEAGHGDGVARFQLQFIDDEHARIAAFLVTARPGSALQGRLLSATGRETLAPLLGQPVDRVEGPLADLERIGDAIEGQAVLRDGAAIPIRVEQHGTAHDLDGNDYRFQILDVPWLIRRYLVSTGAAPRRVDCPVRTAPDGGRVDCVATLEDDSERAIAIVRQGGDHRLLPAE